MQESRLDTLKDKVNALGADTIMGTMSQVGEEYRDHVEKLEEAIAESNALLSTYNNDDLFAIRAQYLQQYFPKTIATLANELSK